MASTSALTMRDLALLVPEDEEEANAFKAIVRSIKNNYPNEWENWKVNQSVSYEDLFGKEISSAMDSKLRFGIPTIDLVRAFYPEAKDLSERAYRYLRKVVINWPLGRALVYSPHTIAAQVHEPSYHEFMDTVRDLRTQGKLTNRDKTSKIMSNESYEQQSARSTPLSGSSKSKKVINELFSDHDNRTSSATKRRSEERGASPPPKRRDVARSEDHSNSTYLLEVVVQKQMEMFSKILEMQSDTNNNMKKLYEHATKPADLNASIDSVPDSTQEDEERADCSRSPMVDWENENSDADFVEYTDDAEEAIKNEIASAQRRLEVIKATKATKEKSTSFDFKPCTTEVEPKFSKADPVLAEQGIECQRLGTDNWKYIRYSEVQKQFQATPTFSALKVNNLFAGVTPSWTSVAILEKTDLILGAITNGLLQQRQIFEELCDKLPQEVKQRVGHEFLGNNSKFRKNSDALLQYVCGRRGEVIQQRRDTYKVKNKALHEIIHSIPPSECHLFKEPELTQVVKDQGGIQKFFPFKKPFLPSSKTTYKPDYKNKKGNFKKEYNKFNKNFNPSYGSGNKRTQHTNNERQDKNAKGQNNRWKGGAKKA